MTEVISFLVIVLRFIIQDFPLCYKEESDVHTVISYRRNADNQTDATMFFKTAHVLAYL